MMLVLVTTEVIVNVYAQHWQLMHRNVLTRVSSSNGELKSSVVSICLYYSLTFAQKF